LRKPFNWGAPNRTDRQSCQMLEQQGCSGI
jgi:hypothetical protein